MALITPNITAKSPLTRAGRDVGSGRIACSGHVEPPGRFSYLPRTKYRADRPFFINCCVKFIGGTWLCRVELSRGTAAMLRARASPAP
jgi:hypothetical protein